MATYSWLGHATFKLKGAKMVIYIDPYQLKGEPEPADLICVTHVHHDHLSLKDIEKLLKPETVIVATPDCQGLTGQVIALKPGESAQVGEVTVEAVSAYNIGKAFHPQANGWVGYIVTLEGTRYYHAGDTDLIPEMEGYQADVAFLPVGGKYTMTATEAAQAANTIRPKVAIPMHWGAIIGSDNDAATFQAQCQVAVQILKQEKG